MFGEQQGFTVQREDTSGLGKHNVLVIEINCFGLFFFSKFIDNKDKKNLENYLFYP